MAAKKDHIIMAPNGYMHGPYTYAECVKDAGNWKDTVLIYKITPVARIVSTSKVERL